MKPTRTSTALTGVPDEIRRQIANTVTADTTAAHPQPRPTLRTEDRGWRRSMDEGYLLVDKGPFTTRSPLNIPRGLAVKTAGTIDRPTSLRCSSDTPGWSRHRGGR